MQFLRKLGRIVTGLILAPWGLVLVVYHALAHAFNLPCPW